MVHETFGHYELLSTLAFGGSSRIYRARDTETQQVVALKVLGGHPSETARRLFDREVKALSELNDPHVVPINASGEIDGRLFIDMVLLEGQDLHSLCQSGISYSRAIDIITQVASALDAIHAVGLVHRDVKPGNILVGAEDFTHLIDFGITVQIDDDDVIDSGESAVGATMNYVAPERLTSTTNDPRSDVYSLACVLFESLTGRSPFEGDISQQVMGHLAGPVPKPSDAGVATTAFDAVIATGMAKDPNGRYQSASSLAAAAQSALRDADADRLTPVAGLSSVVATEQPQTVHIDNPLFDDNFRPSEDRYVAPPPPPPPMLWTFGNPRYPPQPATYYGPGPFVRNPAPLTSEAMAELAPRTSREQDVEVFVFAPAHALRGESFVVQVLLLPPEEAGDADVDVDVDADVDPDRGHRDMKSLSVPATVDSIMSVDLSLPGLDLGNAVQQIRWQGREEELRFGVFVPSGLAGRTVVGTVTVGVAGIAVGHVKWTLAINPIKGDDPAATTVQGGEAVRYRNAFISYAARDRPQVLRRMQLLTTLGISFSEDELRLDPDERWARKCHRRIIECDLFLLCWSEEAKLSTSIRREVDAALEIADEPRTSGDLAIHPLLLDESPVPQPWPELCDPAFHERLVYYVNGY